MASERWGAKWVARMTSASLNARDVITTITSSTTRSKPSPHPGRVGPVSVDRLHLHALPVQEPLQIELARNHPNAARERAWLGVDAVGERRDVIAAARCQVAHRHHHLLAGRPGGGEVFGGVWGDVGWCGCRVGRGGWLVVAPWGGGVVGKTRRGKWVGSVTNIPHPHCSLHLLYLPGDELRRGGRPPGAVHPQQHHRHRLVLGNIALRG